MVENIIEGAKWNYEAAEAAKVRVKIPEWTQDDPLLAWWKNHVGEVVDAVYVLYGDQEFLIYDGDGSGTHKVTNGGGPDSSHRDLPLRSLLMDGDYCVKCKKDVSGNSELSYYLSRWNPYEGHMELVRAYCEEHAPII